MCISKNENYSCWVKRNVWTCSKLSYWVAEVTHMRRTLFELIVIVIVIARMTRNDPPNEHESCWIVNSYSFGSRFSTMRFGHNSITHSSRYKELHCAFAIVKAFIYLSGRIKLTCDLNVSFWKLKTDNCLQEMSIHKLLTTWRREIMILSVACINYSIDDDLRP